MATSELVNSPPSTIRTSSPSISDFIHTPCYCEENVYMLCKRLISIGVSNKDLFVVFISNDHKQVPLWHQRAGMRADGLTIWDYHVICIQRMKEDQVPFQVWDLDSTLPFPSSLAQYVSKAIRPSFQVYPEYQRFFRVVHAPIFLRNFASDRSHMKDSAGNWISQPPSYEPIVAEDGTVHNLDKYMEISSADATSSDDLTQRVLSESFGVVISEEKLEDMFSRFS
ncbi:protein N-terminal glutamine amidohydrolase [Ranunculus cassubicifolius]